MVQPDCTLFANTGIHEIEKVESTQGVGELVKVTKWTVNKEDALQKETDAFIDAVLNNHETAVTGLDGLKALKAIEDVLHMIENNIAEKK
ncbi:hypothetical protein D3C87_1892220 [compost metagenome]